MIALARATFAAALLLFSTAAAAVATLRVTYADRILYFDCGGPQFDQLADGGEIVLHCPDLPGVLPRDRVFAGSFDPEPIGLAAWSWRVIRDQPAPWEPPGFSGSGCRLEWMRLRYGDLLTALDCTQ